MAGQADPARAKSGVASFSPLEGWVKSPEREFRSEICLNGPWQFQPVAMPKDWKDGSGVMPQLPPPGDQWESTPLKIPSPWNVNSFADEKGLGGDFCAYPSYPKEWEGVKMGWMRRQVNVPKEWKGRRVMLQFDALAGDAEIIVNGQSVAHRFDIFFPFQVDVTDAIKVGDSNEVLVGVRKASLTDIKGGKFGRRTYQAGSFWGQHIAGIWQDVFLVSLPETFTKNVFIQPLVDQGILKAEVTIRNEGNKEATYEVGGVVRQWMPLGGKSEVEAPVPKWELGKDVALKFAAQSVVVPPKSEKVVTLVEKSGNALKSWTPETPFLYGLVVDVAGRSGVVDRKYTRFGWRQFKIEGGKLALNGKPIALKGDSWHFMGIPQMTRRYAWAWYNAIRKANGNAVRLHAQPFPEFYLDVADEMGIAVLDETAIWASDGGPKLDDEAYWKDTTDHVAQLVLRDRNHPSVFGWSICNEVRPVIKHVFHGPQEMMDNLVKYYGIWADTCRKLDPTRAWISADGDDDGEGVLPTYVIHYGDEGKMKTANGSGKPWGVGEASGAYYMTPEQSSKFNGERSYESFEGRMEGIAIESYAHLVKQARNEGSYRSVFNLAWYALKPLPLGLKDTSRPPTIDDGIFFEEQRDGTPGVQPERLGPYTTTFNPGYDRTLPSYETWPLFTAIEYANAPEPLPLPWNAVDKVEVKEEAAAASVKRVGFLSKGGELQTNLEVLGLPSDLTKQAGIPQVLFVDGANPPGDEGKELFKSTLAEGGTVVIWGLNAGGLSQVNSFLPAPVELTERKSSSLLPKGNDPLLAGLLPSKLYFSELSPSEILKGGIGGPILQNAEVLLEASNTDWLRWNKRAEYAKTGMVYRSEKESKASGAALIRIRQGNGQILVCNLPTSSNLFKAQQLNRRLLQNMGIGLNKPADVGEPFLKTGGLVRALVAGRFPISENVTVDLTKATGIREGAALGNKNWKVMDGDKGRFKLNQGPLDGHANNVVAYLSFWVMSPRPLDDLLIEPNVPKVDFRMTTGEEVAFLLNGKEFASKAADEPNLVAKGLPLQQGWNHFLVKVSHLKGDFEFSGGLECSQPQFLNDLSSALRKP